MKTIVSDEKERMIDAITEIAVNTKRIADILDNGIGVKK